MEPNERTLVRENKAKQNKLSEEEAQEQGQEQEQEEQEKQEEEKTNICRWIQLPEDILELIMGRLCLADYLGLRAVCSTWRATIANKHCHPLPELPLVVLRYYCKGTPFFSLSTGCVFHRKTPLFEGFQFCHGSVEGWMIVCDYSDESRHDIAVFFLNAVTNARVSVPSMLNYPSDSPREADQLYIAKMVASSKPDCAGCFLVGLFTDYCHIAFCRLSDKSWTMIGTGEEHYFMDVEIFGSKLYVRTDRSVKCILVYDLQDSSSNPPKPKPKVLALLPPIRPPPVSSILGDHRLIWGSVITFLAKDDALQELLLIYMFYNAVHETEKVDYSNMITEFTDPPQVTTIQVFKLGLSNETNQFVKVDNLGDRVLFLSYCKSIVMSIAAFNSTEELIAANSIYFAVRCLCPTDPWEGHQLGVFCLADNSIHYYSIEKSGENEPPYPMWFVPSLW